jgi:hypothetical protein
MDHTPSIAPTSNHQEEGWNVWRDVGILRTTPVFSMCQVRRGEFLEHMKKFVLIISQPRKDAYMNAI